MMGQEEEAVPVCTEFASEFCDTDSEKLSFAAVLADCQSFLNSQKTSQNKPWERQMK